MALFHSFFTLGKLTNATIFLDLKTCFAENFHENSFNFEWPYFTHFFALGKLTNATIFLDLKTCFAEDIIIHIKLTNATIFLDLKTCFAENK